MPLIQLKKNILFYVIYYGISLLSHKYSTQGSVKIEIIDQFVLFMYSLFFLQNTFEEMNEEI